MGPGGLGWSRRRGQIAEIISMTGGLDNGFLWHQPQTVTAVLLTGASRGFLDS